MAYTVLNARVKQKIDTEENWVAEEDAFGVIFEGEQAFVKTDEGLPVNFKIGDGTKKFSELPYFIAYFNNVTNCKVLDYADQTANLTISAKFRNKSLLAKIIFFNNDGADVTLKVGTTDGGIEIIEIVLPNDITCLNLDYEFTSAETLYLTGLTGVDYSMLVLYYQLDEAPVIPPGGSGGITNRFASGTVYSFKPRYVGHTGDVWDLITGYGKTGTDYEGAQLYGVGDLPALEEMYLRGYKTGDTLGGTTGANTKNIAFGNLPEMKVNVPSNVGGTPGGGGIQYNGLNNNTVQLGVRDASGNAYAGQTAFSVEPSSMIVLYFTGVETT